MKDPMEEKLQDLPRAADEALGGLQAAQGLRNRILEKANEEKAAPKGYRRWLTPVLCGCGALAVVVGLYAGGVFGKNAPAAAAGQEGPGISVIAQGSLPEIPDARLSADVGGTVTITRNASSGSMLAVDGRYYCKQSGKVPATGECLGEVRNVSDVSGQSGVCSDCLEDGVLIYAIPGMEGTAVAADDGGTLRLFRRTSFGGTALVGGESLRDTLRGDIVKIEIDGMQPLDGGDAKRLMEILFSSAVQYSSGSSTSGTAFTVTFGNGVKLKLYVSPDEGLLMGCGTWKCPEFFAAYNSMF